jgi:hypothetical protein
MKAIARQDGILLMWERHELGASRRTCFDCPAFDKAGRRVDIIYGTKKAGLHLLPSEARYWVKRYFTNSGYPRHTIYRLPELEIIMNIRADTNPDDILNTDLPNGLKEYLLEDCFK